MNQKNNNKKLLPKRNHSKTNTAVLENSITELNKIDIPSLEAKDESSRPHFLLIDDNPVFLESIIDSWKKYYIKSFTLLSINTKVQKVSKTIKRLLDEKQPIDAIYLDKNLATGKTSGDLISEIRDLDQARYIPIILITSHAFSDNEGKISGENLLLQPDWVLYQKSPSPNFLYQMASVENLGRDVVWDKVWINLIEKCNTLTARRSEQSESILVDTIKSKLEQYLNADQVYLRQINPQTKEYIAVEGEGDNLQGSLKTIDFKNIPFLKSMINQSNYFVTRKDCLKKAEVGKYTNILNHHVLVCTIHYKSTTIGTLSIYRKKEQPTFRLKDEFFIQQLASVLAIFLGLQAEKRKLRSQQTALLDFVSDIDDIDNEDEITKKLGKYLHERFNYNASDAKTSIRMLNFLSGELISRFYLSPKSTPSKIFIDSDDDTAYAFVVNNNSGVLCEKIEGCDCNSNFKMTTPKMKSYMTIPLSSQGLILGAANLEHPKESHYQKEDKDFAIRLTNMAARAILRLRAQNFQTGLLELTDTLFTKNPDVNLLEKAFSLLFEFTGFAYLLYLQKDEHVEHGWKLKTVYVHGKEKFTEVSEKDLNLWKKYLSDHFEGTYLKNRLSINDKFSYSGNPDVMFTEKGIYIAGKRIITRSQAILHPNENTILSLHYRLPNALNDFQKTILKNFVPFLGELINGRDWVLDTYDHSFIIERQAQIGVAYSQARHALVNEVTKIGNTLSLIKCDGAKPKYIKAIEDKLDNILESNSAAKNLVKIPEYHLVDLADIWLSVCNKLLNKAEKFSIDLKPLEYSLKFTTDAAILYTILFNLAQNAIQAIVKNSHQKNAYIYLNTQTIDNNIIIHIIDNGPGISPDIRETLFNLGITTSAEGTGFGLTFAKSRAEDLGGTLEIISTSKPSGTVFQLKLPLHPKNII